MGAWGGGAAATTAARPDCLPTGVFGRSSAAGTETGALADFNNGFATGASLIGAALLTGLVLDTFGGGVLVCAALVFWITFGGALIDFLVAAFAEVLGTAFAEALGAGFAFAALVTLVALAAGLVFGRAFAADFGEVFGLATAFAFFSAGLALATTLRFGTDLGTTFFFTTLTAFATFVDFPLAFTFVAVLVFFAVANLISSAVHSCAGFMARFYGLTRADPIPDSLFSKTRKST